jgi:hypothetical protein
MQNKKMIVFLVLVVVLVGAAAFIGGRMLNQRAGPLGFSSLMGGGGDVMTISIQMTPAAELPTSQPDVIGLFVERKDKSIFIQSVSMDVGKGGGYVLQTNGPGEFVAGSPLDNDGPKVEVVINNETVIYIETTAPPSAPSSGEDLVVQQTVGEGSLDDLTSQSFVTVWGRKSGDRIIAEVIFISNPIMIKRP